MGVVIPQVITEDRAGGAQIIDGSLRFDYGKTQYLTRTPSSAGNTLTWTWSGWIRKTKLSTTQYLFRTPSVDEGFYISSSDYIDVYRYSGSFTYYGTTPGLYRDPSGWYHIVYTHDATAATGSRLKIYVNGVLQPLTSLTDISSNTGYSLNTAVAHRIGEVDGHISQVYFIDGQALTPSYFGYTDPLTNTWRPKKFKPTATPNNGTTWSSYLTTNAGSNFDGSYPVTNAFDNSSTTKCLTANNANGTTTGTSYIQFNSPSSFSGTLKVVCDNGNAVYDLTSGSPVLLATQSTGSDGQLLDCGTVTGISSIRVLMSGGSRPAIGAIYINGVGLIDSLNDTGGVGTNGFYLPLDGNTPIGQDQSGRGNNWTPVNFGGSNTLEKATGALPILNTDGGGKVARVGVRTDSSASSLVLALPLVGIKSDFSNAINSGTTEKVVTNSGVTFASPGVDTFYGTYGYFVQSQSDYLEAASTTDFAFGTGDFTLEARIYAVSLPGTNNRIITSGTGSAGDRSNFQLMVGSAGYLEFDNTSTYQSATGLITTGRWYHVAATKSSGTLRLFIDGVIVKEQADSYNVTENGGVTVGREATQSSYWNGYISDVRVYKGLAKYTQNFIPASTDPDILPDTPSGVSYSSNVALVPSTDGAVAFDGSGDYLSLADSTDFAFGSGDFTIECFVYVNSLSSTNAIIAKRTNSDADYRWIIWNINTSGQVHTEITTTGSSWAINANSTSTVSAGTWNHIALVRNGSDVSVYVNGIKNTLSAGFSGSVYVSTESVLIGVNGTTGSYNYPITGFISNLHVVKGTALYTSNFTPPSAPISSVANTKLLCCKSNSSATAADVTPGTITANGNAVATNFNPFTVNINTQRGQESGWCTWNPLDTAGSTLSNGNLNITTPSSGLGATRGTIGVSSGKWYYEHTITSGATAIGIMKLTDILVSGSGIIGASAGGYSYYSEGVAGGGYTKKINNGTQTDYGASFDPSDTISVAFDLDAGTITFYKNGISQGVAFSGLSGTFAPAISDGTNSGSIVGASNFGQKPFKFPPPAGFQPLALANTPRPTIVRPDQYVGIVTYTGNNGNQSLNIGFKPDFIWFKSRNEVYNHYFHDTVRGNRAELYSNTTGAEFTASTDRVTFTNNGFALDSDAGHNETNKTYVAWAWKAGGNSNTYNINDVGYATASAAGLTAGTITPTGASVNTKSGFSIITYNSIGTSGTVDQIPHGLGKAPAFYIVKNRDIIDNWFIYHKSLTNPNNYRLYFTTGGESDAGTQIYDSTTTYLGMRQGSIASNTNQKIVIYAWAEIPGFSKFGSFTGSSSLPFIYTGFRPRWLLIKNAGASGDDWALLDSARNTYNEMNSKLWPNTSAVEATLSGNNSVDFLANGFKMRSDNNATNSPGNTMIYACFAEAPSFNLYGGQSNAR